MARQDAAPLIKVADRISREGPCAQARDIRTLRAQSIALVNAHRVPSALQEQLTSGVNALIEPPCLPAIPADVTPASTAPRRGHGHGQGHGNGDGNNNGDGGGD
jgi:hypothetical protein